MSQNGVKKPMGGGPTPPPKLPKFEFWGDLKRKEMPRPEMIINGLPRGSVALLQAVTNVGKTTLALNLAVSLATGREFYPLCEAGPPRKILFIDYETPEAMFQDDLNVMSRRLSEEEIRLLDQNFRSYCFMRTDDDRELILENEDLWKHLALTAREWRADMIVIDPVSLAFPNVDENDNTSITSKMHGPLRSIVKMSGAALLFTHHVGKEKSEEGRARVGAYRSRGGSSIGGLARLILDLDTYSETGVGHVTLSCQKVKGKSEPTVDLALDLDTRWFVAQKKIKDPMEKKYERMIEVIEEEGREMKREEIWIKTTGIFGSKETLDRYLERGLKEGKLVKVRSGVYQARQVVRPIGGVA